MEKDQVRGNDSLVTFEEILQIAKDKDVSCLLQKTRFFFSNGKIHRYCKHAKKVVSNSPGLVDFAIGLRIFVLNLPDAQVLFFGEVQYIIIITEGL